MKIDKAIDILENYSVIDASGVSSYDTKQQKAIIALLLDTHKLLKEQREPIEVTVSQESTNNLLDYDSIKQLIEGAQDNATIEECEGDETANAFNAGILYAFEQLSNSFEEFVNASKKVVRDCSTCACGNDTKSYFRCSHCIEYKSENENYKYWQQKQDDAKDGCENEVKRFTYRCIIKYVDHVCGKYCMKFPAFPGYLRYSDNVVTLRERAEDDLRDMIERAFEWDGQAPVEKFNNSANYLNSDVFYVAVEVRG